MQDEAWVLGQAALDLRGHVTGGVIEYEVHGQVLGHVLIDAFQEREELDRAVALVQA